MSIVTFSRQATPQEMAVEIDRRGRAIERLESEVQQLRAALEFYSIRTSYVSRTGMESPISKDGFGDRARMALTDHIGKIAAASDQLATARAEALEEAKRTAPRIQFGADGLTVTWPGRAFVEIEPNGACSYAWVRDGKFVPGDAELRLGEEIPGDLRAALSTQPPAPREINP